MADQPAEVVPEIKPDPRDILQSKTFAAWANSHLIKREKSIQNLTEDLKDGQLFISLIEILEGKDFPEKYEKTSNRRVERLSNAQAFLKHLDKIHVRLVGVNPDALVDGNRKMLLATLWALIRRFHIQIESADSKSGDGPVTETSAARLKKELLEWVQQQVAPYQRVNVTNFTSSFQDGLAFCALVDSIEPGIVGFDSLGDNVAENAEKAFTVAESNLSIPRLLYSSDIAEGNVDEQSIMTYVSYFRNAKLALLKKRELMGHLDEERASKEKLNKAVEDQAGRIKELEDELARLRAEYEAYKVESTETIQSLNQSLSKEQIEKQQLFHNLTEREAKIVSLEEELEKLRRESASFKAETNENIINLKGQVEKLSKQNEDASAKIVVLEGEKEKLTQESSSLKQTVEQLTKKNEESSAKISSLEEAQEKLTQESNAIKANLEKTSQELSSVQEQKKSSENQAASLQQELAQSKAEVETVKTQLEKSTSELIQNHGAVAAELAQTMSQNTDLAGKLAQAQATNKTLEEQYKQSSVEWSLKNEGLSAHVLELETKNTNNDELIRQLREQLASLEKEKNELASQSSSEISSLKEQLGKTQQDLAREQSARKVYEGFKNFVEADIAVVKSDSLQSSPSALPRLAEDIQKHSHAVEVEKIGIPKMQEKINKYHMELSNFHGPIGGKEQEKMQELEILIQQYNIELKGRYRRQSICSADLWLSRMDKLIVESASSYSVKDLEPRLKEIHSHLQTATNVLFDMRHTLARLDQDYIDKSQENDGVFQLMKGSNLLKYKSGGKGVPHRRKFFLHLFDNATIFWSLGDVSQKEAGIFQSTDYRQAIVTDVKGGPSKQVRDCQNLTPDMEALSFTVYTSTRVLDLVAPDQETYELWTTVLLRVLENFRKGFIGASQNVRLKAELMLKEDVQSSFDPELARQAIAEEEGRKELEKKQALESMTSTLKSRRGSIIPVGFFGANPGKEGDGAEGSSSNYRRGSVLDSNRGQPLSHTQLKESVLEEQEEKATQEAKKESSAEKVSQHEDDDSDSGAPEIVVEQDDDAVSGDKQDGSAQNTAATEGGASADADQPQGEETIAPLSSTQTSESGKKDAGRRRSIFSNLNPFGGKKD